MICRVTKIHPYENRKKYRLLLNRELYWKLLNNSKSLHVYIKKSTCRIIHPFLKIYMLDCKKGRSSFKRIKKKYNLKTFPSFQIIFKRQMQQQTCLKEWQVYTYFFVLSTINYILQGLMKSIDILF